MKIPEQSPLGAKGLARRAVLRGAVIGAVAAAPVPFARRLTGGRQADPPSSGTPAAAVSAGCTSLPLV
ncbi:MAG: hypothetical protein QOH03_3002, partial [Kribbellaceae bacterium]|nr:hypothetical protein [Kribbellaceae bacterium]